MSNNMKILSEELKKYTKPTHLVDFTLGQDSSGNPIFASASETAETIDGWLTAGDNVVYRVQYGLGDYAYATTTDHHADSYIMMALFVTTSMFGPNGVYRLEAKWEKTEGTWNPVPRVYSVIPMEKAGSHIITCEEGETEGGYTSLTNFSESWQTVYDWIQSSEIVVLEIGSYRFSPSYVYYDENEPFGTIEFTVVENADEHDLIVRYAYWNLDGSSQELTYSTMARKIYVYGVWNDGNKRFELDYLFSDITPDIIRYMDDIEIKMTIYDPVNDLNNKSTVQIQVGYDETTESDIVKFIDIFMYDSPNKRTIRGRWASGQTHDEQDWVPVYSIAYDCNPDAIAPEFSDLSTYAVGDVVMHDGLRYKCTTAVSLVGTWNSSNWTQEDVQTAINAVKASIPTITMRVYDED